jgi:type VI protein secretion system component VasF
MVLDGGYNFCDFCRREESDNHYRESSELSLRRRMRHERKFRVVERYPGWVRLIALFLVFLAGFLLWRGAIEVIFG